MRKKIPAVIDENRGTGRTYFAILRLVGYANLGKNVAYIVAKHGAIAYLDDMVKRACEELKVNVRKSAAENIYEIGDKAGALHLCSLNVMRHSVHKFTGSNYRLFVDHFAHDKASKDQIIWIHDHNASLPVDK